MTEHECGVCYGWDSKCPHCQLPEDLEDDE